jgi:regulator of cell morphogenesis and NO signaling
MNSAETTQDFALDLTSLTRETRAARALEAFDRLSAWKSLVAKIGDFPSDVLAEFQKQRKGQFDWSVLKSGPPTWEVEISRRDAAPGALRSVEETLGSDHDRLDALERRAFAARDEGRLEQAAIVFSRFAVGLRRHIDFEEQLLFPVFEARAGLSPAAGPTAVMRAEHREILSLIERIGSAVGDAAAEAENLRGALHFVLGEHNLKEEQVLYPGLDSLLGEEKSDELVAQIQAF